MKIPNTIEELVEDLNGVDAFLTATEWEKAAKVYAFTHANEGPGQPKKSMVKSDLSFHEFAALGINGLKSKNTVQTYHKAWAGLVEAKAAKALNPGDEYQPPKLHKSGTCPTEDPDRECSKNRGRCWPPTRTGTNGSKTPEGLGKRIEEAGAKVTAAAIADLPKDEKINLAKELAHDPVIQTTAIVQAEKDHTDRKANQNLRQPPNSDLGNVIERTDIRFAIRDAEKATERVLAKRLIGDFDLNDAEAFEMYAGRAYALGDLLRKLATAIRESTTLDLDAELARLMEEEGA